MLICSLGLKSGACDRGGVLNLSNPNISDLFESSNIISVSLCLTKIDLFYGLLDP